MAGSRRTSGLVTPAALALYLGRRRSPMVSRYPFSIESQTLLHALSATPEHMRRQRILDVILRSSCVSANDGCQQRTRGLA